MSANFRSGCFCTCSARFLLAAFKAVGVFAESRYQLLRSRSAACLQLRSFLKNDVGIGAPNAERVDAGAAPAFAGFPVRQPVVDIKWTMNKVNLRVGLLEVQARWQFSMLESQDGFNHTRNASGGIRVANIGFERSNGAESHLFSRSAECIRQRGDFNRITEFRARSVRLYITNGVGLNPGGDVGRADGQGLPSDIRRCKTYF